MGPRVGPHLVAAPVVDADDPGEHVDLGPVGDRESDVNGIVRRLGRFSRRGQGQESDEEREQRSAHGTS